MEGFYFSVSLDNERTLCLAPLTDRRILMSGQEIADTSGYFLFETRCSGEVPDTAIFAHVLTEDAALRLRDLLNMS